MRRRKRYQQGGPPVNTTGYLKGYKTNQNPVNIIPSGHITTQNMSGPILANGVLLHPDTGDYLFPTSHVIEHKLGKGGHTVSTPQYLSTYPNDKNTLPPMTKSLRGKKSMQRGGKSFDPQINNYMSGIYANGGIIPPGYPYMGYNDSNRHMFAGMMQMGGPMPQPGPAGTMPQPGMMPPGMPSQMFPMQGPQQQAPPQRRGKAPRPKAGKRGRMQGGGMTAQSVAAAKASGYDDVSAVDHINSLLSGGSRDVGWGNPAQNQLAMQAYMYHQSHAGQPAPQTIQSFYGRPSSGVPAADSVRQRLGSIGYGPVSMYNSTPNVSVAAPSRAVASNFHTGGITSRFPQDLSDGEMAYDWKDVIYNNPDYKSGGWISKAVNPAHKGFCSPMSKATCTPRRKALARMFKEKHGFHKKQDGGYLQGMEMQQGGFQPAGSLIDQNQWAMSSDSTPQAPPSGNYYKTDPSQTSMTGALPGQPAIVPLTNMHRQGQYQQNPNNHPLLQALLPINAGLSSLAQHNDWRQRQSSYIQANTNPLSTMGYDNGRTTESRYGYGNFQGGGETMPFAGVKMHLWQRGGSLSGAARTFRPYMLHQGSFQMGGQMDDQDQWELEDADDAEDQAYAASKQQPITPHEDEGYDSEIRRRSDPNDDQDYQAALDVAAGPSFLNNPYFR